MIVAAVLILSISALGQSVFGFGAGLISIPLLSQFFPVKDAVTLSLLLQLALGLLVLPSFRSLQWKPLRWLLLGMLPATFAGMTMLWMFQDIVLRWFLAALLAGFLLRSFFLPDVRLTWLGSPAGALGAGTAAGIVQGMMGTSGPILVMFFSEVSRCKVVFRVSLLLVLFLSNFLRIVLAGPMGMFNSQVVTAGLYAAPFVALAMWGGERIHHLLSETVYRRSILAILSVSLVMLVLKG